MRFTSIFLLAILCLSTPALAKWTSPDGAISFSTPNRFNKVSEKKGSVNWLSTDGRSQINYLELNMGLPIKNMPPEFERGFIKGLERGFQNKYGGKITESLLYDQNGHRFFALLAESKHEGEDLHVMQMGVFLGGKIHRLTALSMDGDVRKNANLMNCFSSFNVLKSATAATKRTSYSVAEASLSPVAEASPGAEVPPVAEASIRDKMDPYNLGYQVGQVVGWLLIPGLILLLIFSKKGDKADAPPAPVR